MLGCDFSYSLSLIPAAHWNRHMGGYVISTNERTVGHIASENPAAARIFEKYRIDYCCGGDKSLAAACEGEDVSPDEVSAELEHATRSAGD